MILRRYCTLSHAGWGRGLLVIEHRAEIAHVEPAFKEVKLDRGRPMAMALVWLPLSFA
jgi:hypothetical protein